MPAKILESDGSDDEDTKDRKLSGFAKFPTGNGFKLNKKYGKDMEERRKKEEMFRIKDRVLKHDLDFVGSEEDSSSDEEISDRRLQKDNVEFLKVISAIRSKDPSIYTSEKRFFEKNEDSSGSEVETKEEKLTLKKYNQKFVAQGGKFDGESEDEGDINEQISKKETFVQEQARLKKAFQSDSDESDNDENDLMTKKVVTEDVKKAEHADFLEWVKGKSDKKPKNKKELEEFEALRETWKNDKIDKDEAFLRDYFAGEAFIKGESSEDDDSGDSDDGALGPQTGKKRDKTEKMDDQSGSSDEDDFLTKKKSDKDARYVKLEDSSEDELFVQKQEQAAYAQMLDQHIENRTNFRHEEQGSHKIEQVPRRVEDSIKQTIEDAQKKVKRKREKEKGEAIKKQKLDDIKLLKKLKEDEITDKLAQIKANADAEELIGMEDMEGMLGDDWDEEKHEAMMAKMYGDDYYKEIGDGTEKPEWDDDELMDFQYPGDDDEEVQLTETAGESRKERRQREREEKRKSKKKSDSKKDSKTNDVMSDTETPISCTIEAAEKLASTNPEMKKLLDERTKLETKAKGQEFFAYRKTTANNFGLDPLEILMADDKDLNQWAPLSKVVSIRDAEMDERERDYFAKQKENNPNRVARVLKSLFTNEEEVSSDDEVQDTHLMSKKKKSKKDKKKDKKKKEKADAEVDAEVGAEVDAEAEAETETEVKAGKAVSEEAKSEPESETEVKPKKSKKDKKKKKSKPDAGEETDSEPETSDKKKSRGRKHKVTKERLEAYNIKNPELFQKKLSKHSSKKSSKKSNS